MPWLGYSPELVEAAKRRLQGISDLAASIPGRIGAVVRRVLEFVEPPKEQITPLPVPAVGRALVWGTGAKRMVGPLYHGTHTGVLKNILQEGLKPSELTGNVVNVEELGSAVPRSYNVVYLTRQPWLAGEYAEAAARQAGKGAEPVVLRISRVLASRLRPEEAAVDVGSEMLDILAEGGKVSGLLSYLANKPQKHWSSSFGYDLPRREVWAAAARALGLAGSGEEAWLRGKELLDKYRAAGAVTKPPIVAGNVGYAGVIPPERLKVLVTGWDRLYDVVMGESKRVQELLGRAIAQRIRQGRSIPWWLR